jgi:hypothetical protein
VWFHRYVGWFDEEEVGHLDSYRMTANSERGMNKVTNITKVKRKTHK